jgi:serine/threonine-protein kinase
VTPAAAPEPTEIAGRYQVVQKLGAGAFGTVYKAKDKILGRMLAIKTIRLEGLAASGTSLEDLMERFNREARISAQLRHPNIVTIYDVGEVAGVSYLAMEFIDGVGLERIIRDTGPFPVERAASIAAQVADALDFAHRQSVVHRDVKPANIMVEAGDRVKVTDFGIAKVTNAGEQLTATGSLLGTPSYMSPEQARGSELDGRSDLFSVGAVLYEMLAGKRAFRGDSITGLIFKVITEEPTPLQELRPDLPPVLVQIVAKAMAKQPAGRFQSGAEMAQALIAFTQPGAIPTVRISEVATESGRMRSPAAAPIDSLSTAQMEPTLGSAPTQVAGPTQIVAPPPPPPPSAGRRASGAARPAVAAAPQAPPVRSEPPTPRRAGSGLAIAVIGALTLVVAGALGGAWYLFGRSKPSATVTTNVAGPLPAATTPAEPAAGANAAGQPAEVPPATVPAATIPAAGAQPTTVAPPPVVTAPPATQPAAAQDGALPQTPAQPAARSVTRTAPARPAPEPEPPAMDYSFLEDENQPPPDGTEIGRRLADAYRGGSGGGGGASYGRYRPRDRSPSGLSAGERPAVATLRHIMIGQEAYYRQHERYASLSELLRSRFVVLDVRPQGDTFARRDYRFQVFVEGDAFRVVALPSGGGRRPFVGDDTGFIRVGTE